MRILAIDTALEACSAAVLDTERGRRPRPMNRWTMARGHAEALMPLIARVLDRAHIQFFSGIDRIAVTTGPGSFTGLRVGISAARGLALAAEQAGDRPVDARRLRRALHRRRRHAAGRRRDRCAARPRLSAGVRARRPHFGGAAHRQHCATPCVSPSTGAPRVVGTGAKLLADAWPSGERPPTVVDARRAPDIDWVARLGAAAADTGAPPKPLYLRAPDAQPQNAAQLARR